MDAFLGKWIAIKDDVDWTPFMKAAGMTEDQIQFFIKNDKENDTKVTFSQEGDKYVYHSDSGPMTYTIQFQLGKPFDVKLKEGMGVKGVTTFENGQLKTESQMTNCKPTSHIRTVSGGKMKIVSTAGNVTLAREFQKM
ncbi:fatty acid-binding protein, brain [Lingula anatina]|uniref:Fatty acid-binding protein, brain n=1 Tax=Lingula anatina TaxID=7574 RepID=A0A1S3JN77_LINAN|nr:fatty acid-binding protein, brain [Lingula anatina]|eukprot:XP_013411606.1 fatty acid-binding protein, brain [Lingula anatina]